MTDQQFSLWLDQLSRGGAAAGSPSGGPGGGGGYQPPRPGGTPGGFGGGMGGVVPTRQFGQQQFSQPSAPSAGGGLWPGGAYPSYGRFLEGINDYLNGPRRPEDLIPGYRGQNVMSTDRPLPGELGRPNMGPGTLYPNYGEPVAGMQEPFYPGANIEPPILNENLNTDSWPFDVRDFPSTPNEPSPFFDPFETPQTADIFGPSPFGDYPGSPDFTPSDAFLPSPPEDARMVGPPTTPAGREGFEPMFGGSDFGPGGSVGFGDNPGYNYAYGPNGETYVYDQNWQWLGQTGGESPAQSQPSTVAFGGNAPPAPGFFTPNTSAPTATANMIPGTNLPNAPGFNNAYPSGGMQDQFGNVIPGTDLSASDQANIKNMEKFPGGGAGQFFKDAAGNIVNAAGKIVQAAGNIGSSIINNIMNDPGYSSPDYLASMGYSRDNPYQPMWPGQASTSGFGVEGRGGSFFGGTMNFNPMGGDISGANNPFGAGQVGRSSVGPPQGGGGPPMWGPMDLSRFTGGRGSFRPYSQAEWDKMNRTEEWRGGKGGKAGSYYDYLTAWHGPTGIPGAGVISGLQYAMSGQHSNLFGSLPSSWFTGITPWMPPGAEDVSGGGNFRDFARGDRGPTAQMMHATSGKYSPK